MTTEITAEDNSHINTFSKPYQQTKAAKTTKQLK
jgi:hypothetical protein